MEGGGSALSKSASAVKQSKKKKKKKKIHVLKPSMVTGYIKLNECERRCVLLKLCV